METITLGLFSLILVVCLLLKLPTLYALFAGLILFCGYAAKKGNSPKKIVSMLYTGVLTAKNILIVFLLIGMMTALWRACGTIPYIICHAAKLLRPEVIAHISDHVYYANANKEATPLVSADIRNNPAIYPPEDVFAKLFTLKVQDPKIDRVRTRAWTKVKSGK